MTKQIKEFEVSIALCDIMIILLQLYDESVRSRTNVSPRGAEK